MPGAQCARSRACSVENTRVSHHGHTGNTRHSPRNGFNGFLRALPGDRALLSPSSADNSANLTPASGRQDHTTSPSASASFVQFAIREPDAAASIASPAALMTLANAPLWRETARVSATDLPDGASEIFFAEGLDSQVTDLPVGQRPALVRSPLNSGRFSIGYQAPPNGARRA